ncbi:MAG: PelD GGDEF domain-containing protein [Pseudomonadota bacterium]|nr:PelD GGDEF domain-containing protein [Pseudomonadota bacterium]
MKSDFFSKVLQKERLPRFGWFSDKLAWAGGTPPAPDLGRSERVALQPDAAGFSARLPGVAWLEILFFGGLLPAALVWFGQAQSLSLVLSALLLSPLLLGLHYGLTAGTLGAVLTAGALAWLASLRPDVLTEFPKAQVIALLLVGMCAGEARDRWAARVRRLSYLTDYHQTRLQQFTGNYQLLQVSHAQLERRLAGGTLSLRTALQQLKLREPVFSSTDKAPLGGMGPWLLDIMVEAGHLHTAAVYALNERAGLQLPAVATVGKESGLSLFNPLLREALRTGTLTSVQAGNESVHEQVIAIIPLVDASGHVHGVVSVNDMPFLSVHQDTFELLGLLGRHIGDILARRIRPAADGQGSAGLRQSLARNLADARQYGLPAALLACKVVDAARREASVMDCCHSSRGLDQSWVALNRKGQPVVLTLLPLTDEAGVQSYLARLEGKEAGGTARARAIVTHLWMLDKRHSADEILAEIAVVCNIEALDAPGDQPSPQHLHAVAKVAL